MQASWSSVHCPPSALDTIGPVPLRDAPCFHWLCLLWSFAGPLSCGLGQAHSTHPGRVWLCLESVTISVATTLRCSLLKALLCPNWTPPHKYSSLGYLSCRKLNSAYPSCPSPKPAPPQVNSSLVPTQLCPPALPITANSCPSHSVAQARNMGAAPNSFPSSPAPSRSPCGSLAMFALSVGPAWARSVLIINVQPSLGGQLPSLPGAGCLLVAGSRARMVVDMVLSLYQEALGHSGLKWSLRGARSNTTPSRADSQPCVLCSEASRQGQTSPKVICTPRATLSYIPRHLSGGWRRKMEVSKLRTRSRWALPTQSSW
ncbi:uncharacterized protein LOC129057675 [Pongo abelii]|uniref:uncharacterized protein LOC129057675 n=1 Tax=Pongo abelii TaxID=9601 RepID=UPI0023E7E55A|nr:uncharacterized protein LOC129057675 [Pongo abelii]